MKIKQYDTLPDHSIIARDLDGEIHYIDSFMVRIPDNGDYSVDYLTMLLFSSTPRWVKSLFDMRNLIVKHFGLQTGTLPEPAAPDRKVRYNCGNRAVLFHVIDRSDSEIVMAEDDKHLYFRASLLLRKGSVVDEQSLFLTTVVQFKNIGGRIYFAPVKPFHKLIMRRLLMRLSLLLQNSI